MSWVIAGTQKSLEGIPWDTIPNAEKFLPSNITTALWLDAADSSTVTTVDGAVSGWNDKSGNGRDSTQATVGLRPTYTRRLNGKNVLTFDGSDDSLAGATMPSFGNITTLSVATGGPIPSNQERGIFSMGAFSNYWFERISYNSGSLNIYISSVFQDTGSASLSPSGFSGKILVHQREQNVNSKLFIDGTQSGSTLTTGAAVTGTIASTTYQIGRTELSYFGDIAEIIVMPQAADADRQKVEGYLAHKWGLVANLPSNHPYKTIAPAP